MVQSEVRSYSQNWEILISSSILIADDESAALPRQTDGTQDPMVSRGWVLGQPQTQGGARVLSRVGKHLAEISSPTVNRYVGMNERDEAGGKSSVERSFGAGRVLIEQ